MPGPIYQRPKRKTKSYQDYLKEYQKSQPRDNGSEPISDKIGGYFYKNNR